MEKATSAAFGPPASAVSAAEDDDDDGRDVAPAPQLAEDGTLHSVVFWAFIPREGCGRARCTPAVSCLCPQEDCDV